MNFGEAIAAMKAGHMVQRAGWNGKNMHIYLEDGYSQTIGDGVFKGQKRNYEPVICMFTAQGKHQPGWLASQPDILAEDWQIVEP
jgi:Protein of unknown function (DUF2829)